MAILDILTYQGSEMEYAFSRGNVGVLADVQGERNNEFALPSLGGACTYPSENDVQQGVVFGTIYTGNFVAPVEADVLTSVGYGANGTEFTGTATGGGETSHVF